MRFPLLLVTLLLACHWMDVVIPSFAESDVRVKKYTSRSAEEASKWQEDLRTDFYKLMNLDELRGKSLAFDAQTLRQDQKRGFVLHEIEFQSTPTRRIKALLALPDGQTFKSPGIVAIHGHGHDRNHVWDPALIYRGFAKDLAERGAVVISLNVGQHEVFEKGRTLMGERLWDCIRCVDYLVSLSEVDPDRIGCAGLSLGGEMAMWLGAMDTRVTATVSSGFLTNMDQMEKNHCMCWKFDGLRELADWADIYSLIAPRSLLCQNGLKEPANDFNVPLARKVLPEIETIYADLGAKGKVELVAHPGGHVVDLPSLLDFFSQTLQVPSGLKTD